MVGSLYHSEHLSRAIFGRLGNLTDLPACYHQHRPLLSGITSPECRQPGKSPNFSVNWGLPVTTAVPMEVVQANSGKTEHGVPSRLCKFEMFSLFRQAWGVLPVIGGHGNVAAGPCPELYSQAKELVPQYQQGKAALSRAFQSVGLGMWVKKPMEQDRFEM